MTDAILYPDTPFALQPSLVLLGRRGSEAHGTFIPSTDPNSIDDRDLIGVCIPPAPWTLGLRVWEGAEAIKNEWDVVLYDFRKFVRLLCKQNPNVIGMLWLEPEDYLYLDDVGRELVANRHLFRCRKAAHDSFAGYAHSQLKKMTGGVFAGYMGAKRKALVERVGYDAKNAAHLVRLLHMGAEYLRDGEMRVRRTWDRDLLITIKRGEWSLAKVKEYAEHCFHMIHHAEENSALPETINEDAVNELVIRAMRSRLGIELTADPYRENVWRGRFEALTKRAEDAEASLKVERERSFSEGVLEAAGYVRRVVGNAGRCCGHPQCPPHVVGRLQGGDGRSDSFRLGEAVTDVLLGLPPIPSRWWDTLPEDWEGCHSQWDEANDTGFVDAFRGDEDLPSAVAFFRFKPSDPNSLTIVAWADSSSALLDRCDGMGIELPEEVRQSHEWRAAEQEVDAKGKAVISTRRDGLTGPWEARVDGFAVCYMGATEAGALRALAADLYRLRSIEARISRRREEKVMAARARRTS